MVEREPPVKRRKLKLSLSRCKPAAITTGPNGDVCPQASAVTANVSNSKTTGDEAASDNHSQERRGGKNADDWKEKARGEKERAGGENDSDSREGTKGEDGGEAYFSANFKAVCGSFLSEESPERHVFTEDERSTVRHFMSLSSRSGCAFFILPVDMGTCISKMCTVWVFLKQHCSTFDCCKCAMDYQFDRQKHNCSCWLLL